jgi:glutamyl/glutaminyl-tRNA synthetase
VAQDDVPFEAEATTQVADAGADFFRNAGRLFDVHANDFKAWTRAVADATARKGARLYMPLRSALTGATHGPELAPLVALMGAERVRRRLERAAVLAGK